MHLGYSNNIGYNNNGSLLNGNGNQQKQLLFTSTKNRKDKKNSGINFHIIKCDSNTVNSKPFINFTYSNDTMNYLQRSRINSENTLTSNLVGNNLCNNNMNKEECIENRSQLIQENKENNYKLEEVSKEIKLRNENVELLLNAAETIIEKGITTIEEINKSYFKSIFFNETLRYNLGIDNDIESDSSEGNVASGIRKCGNKPCGIVGPKKTNNSWTKIKNFKSKTIWLCGSCHKAWKNDQYCYYCHIIYRDNMNNTSNYNDTKSWIQCDYCELWQHIQCEESNGEYQEISKLNMDPFFKYMCPMCRLKRENGKDNKCMSKKKLLSKKNKKNENKFHHNSMNDYLTNKTKRQENAYNDTNLSKNYILTQMLEQKRKQQKMKVKDY
jgi:hypothetical protein